MADPYQPIACSLYDEYEIAIMQKKKLSIIWLNDDGRQQKAEVTPINILVNNKEEFLTATASDGNQLKIRLDRITLL